MRKIVWEEHEVMPDGLGHGVLFISTEEMSEEGILAFIDGQRRLGRKPTEARVLIRKPDSKYPEEFLSDLKREIEKIILTGTVRHGELTPKIYVWINS